MTLEDEDSENDSDYVPDQDDNASVADSCTEADKQLSEISYSRKRKVDEIWKEMIDADSASKPPNMLTTLQLKNVPKRKIKKGSAKASRILLSIFGEKETSKILNSVSSVVTSNAESELEAADSIRAKARETVRKIQNKETVTEIRKFAGQQIE